MMPTSPERPESVVLLAHRLAVHPRRILKPSIHARDAAVLVPLVGTPDGLSVLFTLRTQNVPTHKGQVAFPGGGRESWDADATATALRETEEEIGLPPPLVDVLGLSHDAFSLSGQRVTPVVGFVRTLPALQLSPREIAEVFSVPLSTLQAPQSVYEQEMQGPSGIKRMVPFFRGGPHPIWGLTAWILRELLALMAVR
jgi:8-oxo-dGTP pyrophosphatase MutT (NUDIX family)